jgi:hypothetical protein
MTQLAQPGRVEILSVGEIRAMLGLAAVRIVRPADADAMREEGAGRMTDGEIALVRWGSVEARAAMNGFGPAS